MALSNVKNEIINQNNSLVYLIDNFVENRFANNLYNEIAELAYIHHPVYVFGQWHYQRRKTCMLGKPYQYAGNIHPALDWHHAPVMHTLMKHINRLLNTGFNACLINYYRDGDAKIGAHSDNEGELGNDRTVAALSLGAERKMKFKHKYNKEVIDVVLPHNSLLIMRGDTQKFYKHELPPSKQVKTERYSLTFRRHI